MTWVKRTEEINPAATQYYDEIWYNEETHWQINHSIEKDDWALFDTSIPYWLPASPYNGSYATLSLAVAEAAERGPNDPSIYDEYAKECGYALESDTD